MKRYIGERIRKSRKAVGMTQAQMAERLGVTRRTYIAIERGDSDPRATVLAKISHITNQAISSYFP